jgi:hypothetical protein
VPACAREHEFLAVEGHAAEAGAAGPFANFLGQEAGHPDVAAQALDDPAEGRRLAAAGVTGQEDLRSDARLLSRVAFRPPAGSLLREPLTAAV